MPTLEGFKPLDTNSQVPADPNVMIPEHIRKAAEAADNLHKQVYQPTAEAQPQPEPQQVPSQQSDPQQAHPEAQPQPEPQQVPQQVPQPQPQPQPVEDFTGNADPQSLRDSEWARRYNSMHGRWQQSERSKAAMEQQMSELATELQRTQARLTAVMQAQPQQQQQQQPVHNNLITDADREAYGDELIDLARRAALSTVAPEIESLRSQNADLTKQVKNTARRELFGVLDSKLPQWRQINGDVRFKSWLRLPNIYTGMVRAEMLKEAVDGADAPKVLAFFRDFLTEAHATGQMAPAQQQELPAQQQPARQAAVALETLTAPGKARPAPGEGQVLPEKPIYSRADITRFYDEKRKGLWANRLEAAQAFENDLSLAQREGRIR